MKQMETSNGDDSEGLLCTLLFVSVAAISDKHAQGTFSFLSPSMCSPCFLLLLTYVGHLGHRCLVGTIWKLRLVVVDVLDLHDELGLGLQGPVRQAVACLRAEHVLGLHLAVQPLDGVDVPGAVVDGEGGARPLARQDVLNGAVTFVHV